MLTLAELDTIKEQLADPDDEMFSPQMMALALATKKQRRSLKGLKLNCIMVDRTGKVDELIEVLKLIQQAKSTRYPLNMRFQIIYASEGKEESTWHWSVMDVIMEDGQLHFFLLDAANSLTAIFSAMLAIYKHCPEAKMVYASGSIQHDSTNCATFALDHVFRLAKIPNFNQDITQLVKNHSESCSQNAQKIIQYCLPKASTSQSSVFSEQDFKELLPYLVNQPFQYLGALNFPEDFGPLLRNFQSLSILEQNFFSKKFKGSDFDDLETYILKHVKNRQNQAIEDKRISIKNKTMTYINSLSIAEINEIIAIQSDGANLINMARKATYRGMFTIRHWEKTDSDISTRLPSYS